MARQVARHTDSSHPLAKVWRLSARHRGSRCGFRRSSAPGRASWDVASAAVMLLIITFAPYFEEGRWPYDWLFDPVPQSIREDFRNAEVPNLGKERSRIKISESAYQGTHEHGLSIWVKSLKTIYGLPYGKNAIIVPDPTWCDDPRVCSGEGLKELFPSVPKGMISPMGGVAYHWEQLSSLGWLFWECASSVSPEIKSNKTYFQEFANGVIVGVFPTTHSAQDGNIISIVNGDKWSVIGSSSPPPTCSGRP